MEQVLRDLVLAELIKPSHLGEGKRKQRREEGRRERRGGGKEKENHLNNVSVPFFIPQTQTSCCSDRERRVWHVNVTGGKREQPMATSLSMDLGPLLQKSSPCSPEILSIPPA